ncbi:hypothetical protein GJ744_007165 [Endocarpon pusillum]|uniref:Uncharacterized protein n=1 Tax=Endocarpon pusillum TaxID=364733 RepID=A0A8H7AN05_9EURO|nr:hypothetical protein GJ744_007165 [Endocarpon pusillum]
MLLLNSKGLSNGDGACKEKDTLSTHGGLGIPCRIQRFTWWDVTAVAGASIACILAVVAVLARATAMLLGQTYQLVVLGLMLSIMGLSTQRQIQKLILLYEVRFGASTLQNFDAIIRNDHFASVMSWQPRLILWFLLLLPLGLSVSYKTFSGGSTERIVRASDTDFCATAAPGYQLIGNGLSLLVTVYLPFWMKPALGRTFGFNLYVADNTTAAILDAPCPTDLTQLQSSLQDDQSLIIVAKVNATVTESISPSSLERNDPAYWDSVQESYNEGALHNEADVNGVNAGIWAGQAQGYNWTLIYLSRWNVTQNQTFESQAERFVTTRRTCIGTWNITRTTASLINVANLQTRDEVEQNQSVIQKNQLSIGTMFFQFLLEFDWTSRKTWNQPLPDSSILHPEFTPAINTRSALVAAMLWARIVSHDGPERPVEESHRYSLTYRKKSSDITTIKQVTTLRRSPWLIMVLIIHPILTILAVLAKAMLYRTPISDGFGLISLLAAIGGNGVEMLRGASLSGESTKEIRVRFTAHNGRCEPGYERLKLELGSHEKSDKLDARKRYG